MNNQTVYYRFNDVGCKKWLRNYAPNRKESETLVQVLQYCIPTEEGCTLEAEKFSNALFPVPERVVFISHAHGNKAKAEELKTYLEDKYSNIRCFIDSEVWGNVYDALWSLQTQFGRKKGVLTIEPCNEIARNLFLILSMALTKTIWNCLAFVYLPVEGEDMNDTFINSPWIAQELLASSMFPQFDVKLIEEGREAVMASSSYLTFRYRADVSHLKKGTPRELAKELYDLNSLKKYDDDKHKISGTDTEYHQ